MYFTYCATCHFSIVPLTVPLSLLPWSGLLPVHFPCAPNCQCQCTFRPPYRRYRWFLCSCKSSGKLHRCLLRIFYPTSSSWSVPSIGPTKLTVSANTDRQHSIFVVSAVAHGCIRRWNRVGCQRRAVVNVAARSIVRRAVPSYFTGNCHRAVVMSSSMSTNDVYVAVVVVDGVGNVDLHTIPQFAQTRVPPALGSSSSATCCASTTRTCCISDSSCTPGVARLSHLCTPTRCGGPVAAAEIELWHDKMN